MRTPVQKLKSFLDENHVKYETIHHSPDFTAQETAAHTHTRGRDFAKTVIVQVAREYAMAVLPAHHKVDLAKLRALAGAKEVRLATEPEMDRLCPDCETGAVPPFGILYGLPVWVSSTVAADDRITFNAGTHQDAVRMTYTDFAKLVQPHVADFSVLA